jgi:hypothetical protein
LDIAEAGRPDAFTREFVGAHPTQAAAHDQATFASLLDRQHLYAAGLGEPAILE